MKTDKKSSSEFWISPFDKIVCAVDTLNGIVQIYEFHARGTCRGASAWVAYHYPRTSAIVESAELDGARNIFTLKLGSGKLNLKPSISPAGIESIEVTDKSIQITYAGLAGGGVGIARSRALAKNIENVEIISASGGSKLGRAVFTTPLMHKVHIGIDDTDSAETGATWSLANEIGWLAGELAGIEYLNHTIVQLYPKAPGKTKNCVSTVLTFGVKPNRKSALINFVSKQLEEHTVSDDTGMAVWEGIKIPNKLKEFTKKCRTRIVKIESVVDISKDLNIQLIEITGRQGLIGAVGAIGYSEQHKNAVKLP